MLWHLIWYCFALPKVITVNFLRDIVSMYFDQDDWKIFRKKSRLFDRLRIAQQQALVYWKTFFFFFHVLPRWSNIWSTGSRPRHKLEPTDRQRMMRYSWKKAGIMYNSIKNALRKKIPHLRNLTALTDRYY